MNINIVATAAGDKELYLFGEYVAAWDPSVADDVLINYAIKEAKEIGKREKAQEIRKALGL